MTIFGFPPGAARTAGAASTVSLPSNTTALNIQSGLLDIDTQNSKIGIGTTAPAVKLEVDYAASTIGARFWRNDGTGASTIDFGNGSCDNAATVSINGKVYDVTM